MSGMGSETTRDSQRRTRVQTVLRVSDGSRFVGDVVLDANNRVWRRAVTIPSDIVLKAVVAFTRQDEACGRLTSRGDGREYLWHVVGAMPMVEMAEAS
jgi:hypothetical protein